MFKLLLVILGFVSSVQGQCVDINTTSITNALGYQYDDACYQHVKSHHDCCQQFILNPLCLDMYSTCNNYKNLTLHNIKDQCDGHQDKIINVSYSDSCHNFTLQLQPYCCDNITQPDCLGWYTNCMSHGDSVSSNCIAPSKYRNSFCNEYVFHVEPSCCDDYSNTCDNIYYWCLDNNPNRTSIMDLFVGPVNGYLSVENLLVVNDIKSVEECADYCIINNRRCVSFNFLYNHCHINTRVRGDSGTDFVVNSHGAVYYEKKFEMPVHDTDCNVKRSKWLGDGICDNSGGYNTENCNYDNGDCCLKTCSSGFCGFARFNCIDPMVLNPPTDTSTPTTTWLNQFKQTPTPTPTPTHTHQHTHAHTHADHTTP